MSKKAKKEAAIGCWGVINEDHKYIKALLSEDDPAKPSSNFEPPTVDEDFLWWSPNLNAHLNPYIVENFCWYWDCRVNPELQDKPFEDLDEYLCCNKE